jgi:phosphoribosylamine--glycine ligase/phosphoribosylformylglycinamidine cyclo-ligase
VVDETNLDIIVRLTKDLSIDLVVPTHGSYVKSGELQRLLREGKFPSLTNKYNRAKNSDIAEIAYFAPEKGAAMIENSRVFAKNLMYKYVIPTPEGNVCTTYNEAFQVCQHLDDKACLIDGPRPGAGIVIKADTGEAFFPKTNREAIKKFGQLMPKLQVGNGNEILYEELIKGEEISVLSFSDGKAYRSLPYALIQKRAMDRDLGPITKGMGCTAPIKFDNSRVEKDIDKIIHDTFQALKLNGKEHQPCCNNFNIDDF